MATHNIRRGTSVSQYIDNLNTLPPAASDSTGPLSDDFDPDSLNIFANTELLDFDMGDPFPEHTDLSLMGYDPLLEERARRENASGRRNNMAGLDYMNMAGSTAEISLASAPFFQEENFTTLPSEPLHSTEVYSPSLALPNGLPTPSTIPQKPSTGSKRKADAITATTDSSQSPDDETSRLAAEEDKRRRNTAASARFRVKKKQREQALETQAKNMTDKVTELESRISSLELENKWLKSLITEKNGDKAADMTEMWKKHNKDRETRSTSNSKDGVGTE